MRCWRIESNNRGREMGIVTEWLIFVVVVALMADVVDPLIIILLWVIGRR